MLSYFKFDMPRNRKNTTRLANDPKVLETDVKLVEEGPIIT